MNNIKHIIPKYGVLNEKKLRVLHIASFYGNLGDAASHMGLYNIMHNLLSQEVEVTQVEIRRFYKNYSLPDKMTFDEKFVEMANEYDLMIIGGGGFLDYWVPGSATGTTIDISEENIKKLSVPTLFASLGCLPHKDIPEGNIEKLHQFIRHITEKDNTFLALRNDGSTGELQRLFASEFSDSVNSILDNAFFLPTSFYDKKLITKPYIAINTAVDQLYMKNRLLPKIEPSEFHKEMTKLIQSIIDETDFNIVLVPHIFRDTASYVSLLDGINDFYVRERISIAPYLQGEDGCRWLFSIYKHAHTIIGMRYHSNVCNIALQKRVFGLAALDRIIHMYSSMGMSDNVIDASHQYASKVLQLIHSDYQYNDAQLEKMKAETLNVYKKFFQSYNFSIAE